MAALLDDDFARTDGRDKSFFELSGWDTAHSRLLGTPSDISVTSAPVNHAFNERSGKECTLNFGVFSTTRNPAHGPQGAAATANLKRRLPRLWSRLLTRSE